MKKRLMIAFGIMLFGIVFTINLTFVKENNFSGLSLKGLNKIALAQTESSDCKCTVYDIDNFVLEMTRCWLWPWQQKLDCTEPSSGKCCKQEWIKTCSGGAQLPVTISCSLF